MDEKQKIEILLHEYDTLREEVINRANQLYQILAMIFGFIGGGFFIWFLSDLKNLSTLLLSTIILIVCFLLVLFMLMHREIFMIVSRISELEKEINKRAGERLLVWETEHGSALHSIFFYDQRALGIRKLCLKIKKIIKKYF